MKITYDQTVDAMRIDFQRGNYEVSEEVGEGIIIDMNSEGKIIAIEILDASEKMSSESLKQVVIGSPFTIN